MKVADLHLHTFFSDGTYSPEELVQAACGKGLSAISVVDHDTIGGIAEAIHYGDLHQVEVIPGIELTVEYDRAEVHFLGYFIDYKNKNFLEKLQSLSETRVERIHKITSKLKGLGLNLEPESVFEVSKKGTVGRLHVARAMVAAGLVGSSYEAFQKYIGDKGPAYVSGFKLSPKEGIKLIKEAGGVPVLAHPYSMNRDEAIPKFVDFGLMGLEVYYPEHTQSDVNFYLALAKKYNLLVTGGSDCHGAAKPEVKIGIVKLPYELVEKIKEARGKL